MESITVEAACCSGNSVNHERVNRRDTNEKTGLLNRLSRIEGQIRGVRGMIEEDVYCDDVLNQLASIRAALDGVGKLLLASHVKSCVIERLQQGDQSVIDEWLKTVHKLLR